MSTTTPTKYVAALAIAGTEAETVQQMADCMTLGKAARLTEAQVARHRMIVERLRECPTDAQLADLQAEAEKIAGQLQRAEVKLEDARNGHVGTAAKHQAAQRQLADWRQRVSARNAHRRDDPIIAQVLDAFTTPTPAEAIQ